MEKKRKRWEAWWKGGRKGAMTYPDYVKAVQQWSESRTHSGPKPSEALSEYTRLNAFRMHRIGKTADWSPDLDALLTSGVLRDQHWVVITESWCGDAAQTVPLIGALAERAHVPLDVVLRDAPSQIIEDFLTNGGRAIPLWIVADSKGEVLMQWGPRPQEAQEMVADFRLAPEPKPEYRVFAVEVQKWYARDKGASFFREAMQLISQGSPFN